MIEAASLSDGELAWVYAGYESLWIHDRHDARWINAAEGGNWSDDEFSDFLRAYGLVRGKAGHNVFCEKQKQNRQKFANLCRDMFMAPLPLGSEWAELTRRWVCAAKKVGSRFEQENGFLSATSKVLWFYHPDHWVMYDTLNRAGLKTWTGKATDSAEAFADAFCNFFDEFGRRGSQFATAILSRPYPYQKRVGEKYLWLLGNRKRKQVLAAFRDGLSASHWPLSESARTPTDWQKRANELWS